MAFENDLYNEDVIYHYTNSGVAFEHILPHSTLRFSSLGNTNDPFEYRTLFTNANYKTDNLEKEGVVLRDTVLKIGHTRQTNYQVACFCRNESDTTSDIDFSEIRNLGCAKSRMWSQYGESHKGVVLVFSKKDLHIEIQKPRYKCFDILEDVIHYDGFDNTAFPKIIGNRISEIGQEEYSREFLRENQKQFFFTKDRDEKEYRIVLGTESKDGMKVDITDSLMGIIIGDRFPDGLLPSLKFFAEKYKVNCRRIMYFKGVPSLLPCEPASRRAIGDLEFSEF